MSTTVNSMDLTDELADEGLPVDFARMVRTITANKLPVIDQVTAGEFILSEEVADQIRAIWRNGAKAPRRRSVPEALRPWTTLDTVLADRQGRADEVDRFGPA